MRSRRRGRGVEYGPRSDPAHIAGTHDAVAALKAIADVRAAFVSRGDKSGCRRDVCWNLIGSLRSEEDTWSGSKVNRVIGEFLGQALPSVDFAHSDLT
jgi:ABC-type tungstate transport system permease subunit